MAASDPGPEARAASPAASPRLRAAGGAIVLLALAAVLGIWAWQKGAYFGTALYPGTVALCAVLVILLASAPAPRLRSRPALIAALAALAALGLWAAASALWSPAPAVAIADAQRILTYLVILALAIWGGALLADRPHLPMAAACLAGLIAALITAVAISTGHDLALYLDSGTLQFPLGYRNANAAFFLIAVWPSVILAASGRLDWRLRALALGAATLCLELGMLSQSRGSLIGAALALIVYVVASRDRARAALWLALAALPALIVIGPLAHLFHAAHEDSRPEVVAALHSAGHAALAGAGLALVAGAAVAIAGRRWPASERTLAVANRAVTAGAVTAVLAGAVAFVALTHDPFEWIGSKVKEFRTQGTPSFRHSPTRFGLATGSSRYPIWRVALDEAADHPLLGLGGGGFHFSYLRNNDGKGPETVRDAHSVELEILSELGIPGLAALLVCLGALATGAARSRSAGPDATAASAAALSGGAYWLGHASVDWFWPYPAVTALALALLGFACGLDVAVGRRSPGSMPWGRWMAGAAACLLALSVVPPYLSDRYVNAAYDTWQSDRMAAYRDLERAADLNPLSEDPYLAEGLIAKAARDRRRAIAAFRDALSRTPDDWTPHYYLALLAERRNPRAALREIRAAARLAPHEPPIAIARRRIEARLDHRQRTPPGTPTRRS